LQEYPIYNAILKPHIGEDLVLGRKYRSPLPERRDSTPSFSVRESKGRLVWQDFGYPDATGNKIENLVMELSPAPLTFKQAKDLIAASDYPQVEVKSQAKYDFTIKYGSLDYTEVRWFDDYNISPRTLKKYKVMGARRMWCGDRLIYDYEYDPMAFVYLGETRDHWQFYGPKPQHKKKWFHRNGSWILGFEQLPLTGKVVRLMSSMKDGLCGYEATGIPPLSGNGEGDFVNFKKIMPELRLRFRKVDALYDPDQAGRKSEARACKELEIDPYPMKYPNDKDDVAAISKKYGLIYLKEALTY
jgi:hypothetical protein